ncbi:hypothetical protein [Photorhabdus australis]|uniref:CIS tube protein n=1 Tax=Photorhabdus australis TaxID=286156 RepID=UPI00055B2325|nr:hypothetical protein [Photorhabdus australis]
MSLLERGLAKLTITGWKERERKHQIGKLEAMYNPETLQLDYQTDYLPDVSNNQVTVSNRYVLSKPAGLTLSLLFDANMAGLTTTVESQLTALKSLCLVNASTDEPNFLEINWGAMRWENKNYFVGRASGLSLTYLRFDRNATPLRVSAQLTLVADESFVLQDNQARLDAPPVSVVNVPDLTSLPALANIASVTTMLGVDYLMLARTNDMDNLDDMQPGQTLRTPEAS